MANHVASQHKLLKIIITKSAWHSPNLNLISSTCEGGH